MPEAPTPILPCAADAALERHASRRARSAPTLSVLSGPVGVGVQAWRRWAAARRTPIIQLSSTDPAAVVAGWAAALACERDLIDDALRHVAGRMGRSAGELRSRFSASTLYDLERFCDATAADWGDGTWAACRWLVTRLVLSKPLDPKNVAPELDEALGGAGRPWVRVLSALAILTPADALPSLLLFPAPGAERRDWLRDASGTLADLLTHVPGLHAAVAVEAADLADHLRVTPESRGLALLREGLVPVASLDEAGLGAVLEPAALEQKMAGPVRRLAADGVGPQLARTLADAVRLLKDPASPEAADRARSGAERFLFERLESLPQTAGLFALNATLDFRFGMRAAEADFLARDLRLVIEIDGFFHFLGPDAYRRDRRKDWELQRRGYMVLRFLAEDVVPRLEEVLDAILAAVALGGAGRQSERASER